MNGELIYLYFFNLDTNFTDDQVTGILKNQEEMSKYEYTKPKPDEIAPINVPSVYNFNSSQVNVKNKLYNLKVQSAIYTTGDIVIRIRCQFENAGLEELQFLSFDDELFKKINDLVDKTKSVVIKNLKKIKPFEISKTIETYRFYYIDDSLKSKFLKYDKFIASLLIDEKDYESLNDNYVLDVLKRNITYDKYNSIYVGWESALIIGNKYTYEHEIIISEIANIQLLEMRIYHKKIIEKLKTVDSVLNEAPSNQILFRKNLENESKMLGNFYYDIRNNLTLINDSVFDFGEWYISKVYGLFESVFKLTDWKKYLDIDMEAINQRYEFIKETIQGKRELFLEYIIIILIAIEIIIEVFAIIH